MTTFDQREEAFEKRFAHDEELLFRAHARRNAKVGRWAAELMGKAGPDAQAYAESLVALEVNGGGDAVLQKLRHDLEAAGVPRSDHQIQRELSEALAEAQREVLKG